jgi:hypothetical protein
MWTVGARDLWGVGVRLSEGEVGERDWRVMSLRELWSPKTRAPKIRNVLSNKAGRQTPVSHARNIRHVTNVAAY